MHEELTRKRTTSDFTDIDGLKYQHYRQLVLEDPDEVWMEETETGERHYTFISHFRQGEERMSYVVITLAIDGVPSFVFLNFPTCDEDLVDSYRRGVDLRVNDEKIEPPALDEPGEPGEPGSPRASDALAETPEHDPELEQAIPVDRARNPSPSNDFESIYAEARQPGDIPRELFGQFEDYLEPTIDDPDEIWRFVDHEKNAWCTFIARFRVEEDQSLGNEENHIDEFMMVVVCHATGESLETVFAFPTLDLELVSRFRKGLNSLNKAFGVGWARGRAA